MSLSSTQTAILESTAAQWKFLFRIGSTTPHLFCSGQDPVSSADILEHTAIDGTEIYYPKPMDGPPLSNGNPQDCSWYLALFDGDFAMFDEKWDDRDSWVKKLCHFIVLGRTHASRQWREIFRWVFKLRSTEHDHETGWMRCNLTLAGGVDSKAGLMRGNIIDDPLAPKPNDPILVVTSPSSYQQGYYVDAGPRRGATDTPPPEVSPSAGLFTAHPGRGFVDVRTPGGRVGGSGGSGGGSGGGGDNNPSEGGGQVNSGGSAGI